MYKLINNKSKVMNAKDGLLKKRLLGVSILFHISLVLLAMTTYYTVDIVNDPNEFDEMTFVEIQFTNSSKSSGMASTKKSVDNTPIEKATARAIEEKVVKVEPLEEVEEVMVIENKDVKVSKKVSDNVNNESSKTEGDGDEGEMITGSALGSLDFDGEGVFGRKVIYHAPIKTIAEENGRIAINLAINRAGNVVGAAINKEGTTIEDKALLIKGLKLALKYRFESDYTAPKVQYGRFTFIFVLKKV